MGEREREKERKGERERNILGFYQQINRIFFSGGIYQEVKDFLEDNIIVSTTASNIIDDTDKLTKEIKCKNKSDDSSIADNSTSLSEYYSNVKKVLMLSKY